MGLFDKVLKSKDKNNKMVSRYTIEMLNVAHENMWWRKAGERDVGMMKFPVNNSENDEVEIYYQAPKESADTLLKELFTVLHKIDDIANNDGANYDITYFDVTEDKITIGYWGTEDNSSFDVKVLNEAGKWYCAEIGTKKYNPPLSLQ